MIMHTAHHEKMCNRAKQNQAKIHDRVDWNIEKKYRGQPKDRKQAAEQHQPDMAFIHRNSF
jgi:hypothetical protein